MRTRKIHPKIAAPVKRESVATVSCDRNAIVPSTYKQWLTGSGAYYNAPTMAGRVEAFQTGTPFAGDDAE